MWTGRRLRLLWPRGRARVEQAVSDSAALDRLAVEARIAPARRGLLEWTSRHDPRDVQALFSLGELFRLGGGQRAALDGWGTSHEALNGCFCLRFPDETGWELGVGRADTGQAGARAAELNLRVAVLLSDLHVPATLFPRRHGARDAGLHRQRATRAPRRLGGDCRPGSLR